MPRIFFEFGTYKGYTTRLLLENINGFGKYVTTLDIGDSSVIDSIDFQGDDESLAREAIVFRREYLDSSKAEHVEQLLLDSMMFNAEGYAGQFDFIFVDANHKLEYVERDTLGALAMLAEGGCIAWHDYGNPQFPELTHYLDSLCLAYPVYHIEETMICFYMPGVVIPDSIGRLAGLDPAS